MRKILVSLTTASLCAASVSLAGGGQGQVPVDPGQGGQAPVHNAPGFSANPFQLAHLAYRGYLGNQGVRSYGGFCSQWESGEFDSKEIIAAGVAAGRVSVSAVDVGYLTALESHIWSLCRH